LPDRFGSRTLYVARAGIQACIAVFLGANNRLFVARGRSIATSGGRREPNATSASPDWERWARRSRHRVIEVGHAVTVWNRSADKLKPLIAAGAAAVATPTELAGKSDVVITILTDTAAMDAVYQGPSGLLAEDVRGKLFIEMSTVQPQNRGRAGDKGARAGRGIRGMPGRRLDRSGAARQADRSHGRRARRCRARQADPRSVVPRLEHCGPVGSGAVMKLTINMPLMIYWQALARRSRSAAAGLDPARIMDLLADTSGGPMCSRCAAPASPACSRAATAVR